MASTVDSVKHGLEEFETTDLNLAAFLRVRDFPILNIIGRNGRAAFVFADTSALRKAVLDYANDGKIPVRTFCNTLRDLKSLTRSAG